MGLSQIWHCQGLEYLVVAVLIACSYAAYPLAKMGPSILRTPNPVGLPLLLAYSLFLGILEAPNINS